MKGVGEIHCQVKQPADQLSYKRRLDSLIEAAATISRIVHKNFSFVEGGLVYYNGLNVIKGPGLRQIPRSCDYFPVTVKKALRPLHGTPI
jgi:uncharacterized membrane protein (DUF2068 family)